MPSTSSFLADLQNGLPELQALENMIEGLAFSHTLPVRPLINHVLASKGKRVRPLLVILSSSLYISDKAAVIDVASAAELIHLASIVHDDVVDSGEIRRGRPTLNSCHGNNVAVLIGDILFAHALELLDKHAHFGVLKVMSKAISLMCEGELEQFSSSFDLAKTEAEYLEQVRKKTGALMGACCEAGARLSEMPEEEIMCLRAYGEQIGCAFQIIDDIFDFTSEPEELGKSVGLDVNFGIITLPLIYLLQDSVHRPLIGQLFSSGLPDTSAIRQIQNLVINEGYTDLAFSRAKAIVKKAKAHLEPLPDGCTKELLQEMAEHVLTRKK
ncbi:MAG TPA: polyprenyl synthetase family protein [Firmicutes bacterium]|nr:polyprenyl synthetase family protein [Bacillota bacterium]